MDEQMLKNLVFSFTSTLGNHDFRYHHLRQSSVLVPLMIKNKEVFVLLTKRSKNLRTHAGAVALPGGVKDSCEESDVDTALREAEEEIGLQRKDVTILGVLPPLFASPRTTVVPVIGIINSSFTANINKDEVDYVFYVALKDFRAKPIVQREFNFYSRRLNIYYLSKELEDNTLIIYGLTICICIAVAVIVDGGHSMPAIFAGGSDEVGIETGFTEYYHYIATQIKGPSKL
ncbi:hypothetical protein SNE40_007352 [Patella caerulea]|uniref:Nudix hydrolase domain-containing protein n=1 Tax=Patella caerulea TaxID=87958 RepID=A0AAN8Q859_PATCE